MDERFRFVRDALSDRFTMTALCARHGISRRVGYKWLERFEAHGRAGLADRSCAPRTCPHKTADHITELLIAARLKRPHWGARKLLRVLRTRHHRITDWPAASTVTELFERRGLVRARSRRRRPVHPGVVAPTTTAPNDLWTADFKGQFRTGNGAYCFPLTIADQHTRYLLMCHGLLSTKTAPARPVFEAAFRDYGLPRAIRTDNGVPFATQALHGLSLLSVWWMRLGIVHQRIHPGCPQENGAHERMHRTFKREAIKPVRHTCRAQQRNFNAFQREYNEERPHEYLNQETPASQYATSPRPYPERLPALEYPGHFLVKRVTAAGTFRFQNRLLYITTTLVGQHLGLEETDDGIWTIFFGSVLLATFDERDYIITS